jgi:hypothetical protein
MTRGNQREIDRQRAANRHAKGADKKSGDPTARREADAKALQEKIARKQAAADAGGGTSGGGGAGGGKGGKKGKS